MSNLLHRTVFSFVTAESAGVPPPPVLAILAAHSSQHSASGALFACCGSAADLRDALKAGPRTHLSADPDTESGQSDKLPVG